MQEQRNWNEFEFSDSPPVNNKSPRFFVCQELLPIPDILKKRKEPVSGELEHLKRRLVLVNLAIQQAKLKQVEAAFDLQQFALNNEMITQLVLRSIQPLEETAFKPAAIPVFLFLLRKYKHSFIRNYSYDIDDEENPELKTIEPVPNLHKIAFLILEEAMDIKDVIAQFFESIIEPYQKHASQSNATLQALNPNTKWLIVTTPQIVYFTEKLIDYLFFYATNPATNLISMNTEQFVCWLRLSVGRIKHGLQKLPSDSIPENMLEKLDTLSDAIMRLKSSLQTNAPQPSFCK